MKRWIYLLISIVLVCGCSNNQPVQQVKVIEDNANILKDNAGILTQYMAYNGQLLKDFDIDFRVITTDNADDIDLFAHKKFTQMQKETRSKSGKLLLMVINTNQDKFRLEVAMALEGVYPDAFVSYLENVGVVPYLRDNKLADAVYAMTELIFDRAHDAAQGLAFSPAMAAKSMGGGAKTRADIGRTSLNKKDNRDYLLPSGATPSQVFAIYMQSNHNHSHNDDLAIFTAETKAFFKKWTKTDINMDHEYELMSKCSDQQTIVADNENFAVLRFPIEPRFCAPYFFKKENGEWKLDIATMSKVILFNHEMAWHFNMEKKIKLLDEYAFAFRDYSFDQNGFPFLKKDKNKKHRWGFSCGYYTPAQEPEKKLCAIVWLGQGDAKYQLGLRLHDVIIGIGKGADQIQMPSARRFFDYLHDAPKNEPVYVSVVNKDGGVRNLKALAP